MKFIFTNGQRRLFMYAVAVWLVCVATANLSMAQQGAGIDPGILRIKVSEELANHLETSRLTRDANNVLLTGIQSLDLANVQYKVSGMKRVFRSSGKFEDKHRRYGLHRWYEVQMDKSVQVLEALASYGAIQSIEKVEPSYTKKIIGSDKPGYGPRRVSEKEFAKVTLPGASNDPLLGAQWHYNNTGQAGGTPGSDISLFDAWGIETGTPNVVVAVTDGGAQVNHPDLAANVWINADEIAGNNIDDDNNGFVDDVHGYSFVGDTDEITPDDHGTHTSGTIAAVTNNGTGVAGVAGGSGTGDGARVMTLETFIGEDLAGGFAETYIYGADNGAVISQNSWGYTVPGAFEPSVLEGIDYFVAEAGKDENGNQIGPMRGGIVIFAAGNSNSNNNWYPGFYEKTLAVGGLNNQDKKAWYSNFGAWVDVSAPGGETFVANDPHGVLSTVAGGQYAFFQGTSMACPHVSGVAALVVSKFGGPGFTPEMLRARLTQLADNVNAADPAFAGLLGSGRVNAFRALQLDDGAAPEAITDLATAGAGVTNVTLRWTAPADAGSGLASVYDIRYATFPITAANFGSATAVANPPAPLPAGSQQSYTVQGLLPGTLYYFAIKSADFFGLWSGISNVLQQATQFPPIIGVSPDTITATLQTAQTTTRILKIVNSGTGTLHFQFDSLAANAFATPSPVSGTVAFTDTLNVVVTIDANNLLPGSYTQNLDILSDDPINPVVTVPVLLDVISNGAPIASVEPDSLDFGQLYEADTATLTFTVHNAGAEVLYIGSITSSESEFTTDFTDTIAVAPFQDVIITVTYSPGGLGVDVGNLFVHTNDPVNSTLNVFVRGEGVPAPQIQVTPASLSATLNTGRTQTQTLTVRNTGGSNLQFSVAVDASPNASVATVQTITIPVSGGVVQSQSLMKSSGGASYPNQVQLKSVGQMASVANVLILTPDDNVSDMETILDAFTDVEADVFPGASLPTISLADLENYDIVFVTNNTQWLQGGNVDPEVIGDLLADYIDAGGKVISNQFSYSFDAWRLEGRFIDEQYGPFTPATSDAQTTVELGDILSPGHPILKGVSSLEYTGFVQSVGLASNGTALAEWSNGQLFLAANSNVVALNMLPSLGNGGPLQFTGDLPLIYHNAIHFLNASFLAVTPSEGTIAAGAQLALQVTFDATGLDSGRYEGAINIATNIPNRPLVVVPAVLNVLGEEFIVSPEALHEELEKNQTSVRTLVITNNGTVNRTYNINVEGTGAEVSVARIALAEDAQVSTAPPDPTEKISHHASQGTAPDLSSSESVELEGTVSTNNARLLTADPIQLSDAQYATDFENFTIADINGQRGWRAQFGNWRVGAANPYSGSRHFRGLSDGFGQSLAITPRVPIGTEEKSTASAVLNIQGSGVTWQFTPQSPTAALVNTRIQFAPNGVISALRRNGAGAVFDPIGTTPSGYFKLSVEVDRDSAYFNVYINDARIYTGQGFAGNIEEVVILSAMEIAGPTLDVDDIKILDGEKSEDVSFVSVSPLSGNLPAGSSATVNVTFNSANLDFGSYDANINIRIADRRFTVPATLRVFGDPQIDVDPTFIQAMVDYGEKDVRTLALTNNGGDPLEYNLQVIGADPSTLLITKKSSQPFAISDRVKEKQAKDNGTSRAIDRSASAIQLFTGTALLEEDFEGGTFPPAGWQVVDNEGNGVVWQFAANYDYDNFTGGTGEAATMSSDEAPFEEYDAELITPSVSTQGFRNITVQYNVNYQNLGNLDLLELDIQVDGGAWTTVVSWNEDHGTLFGTGAVNTVSLDEFIGNGSSFRLRWHYYDPVDGDFDWYAQVDDVVILGDSKAWLSVSPASGTVPVGSTVKIEARFNSEGISAGSHVAGILVNSNDVEDPLIGVVAQLIVRNPPVLTVTPSSLYQELLVDEQATKTITIANSGVSPLKYAFGNTPLPSTDSATSVARTPLTSKRTQPSTETIDFTDPRAMQQSVVPLGARTTIYATSFEEFETGDIDGQEGWFGEFSNWVIDTSNPFEGAQHITSVSDGFGLTRAFSPSVAIGTDPVSSLTLRLQPGRGVTWTISPQSPSAGFVNTRIQINSNGFLSALVSNGNGGASFTSIPVRLPEDRYSEMRIDVERATLDFTLFIDGEEIFKGKGFAGSIEQVVLSSAMQVAGPILDVDNLAIYDGPAVQQWYAFSPKSGIVPPGGSATITVAFDATDLAAGYYTDTLKLSSNDPNHKVTDIPVTLRVLVNTPPVLAAINPVNVIETATANVTFKATDIDNEPVTVVLEENLGFITRQSTANGTATYRIQPLFGDAGVYDLNVIATDARGKKDTAVFHLTVTAYGVGTFTLINTRNNSSVITFTDTVDIDIAQRDFSKLTIRANTNPATVGSVKFWIDGRSINTDNTSPYTLDQNSLQCLSGRDHTITAKAYTKKNAAGTQGSSLTAVIHLINSASVTDFDVVKSNGSKLTDLNQGSIIDASKSSYSLVNIKANTSGSEVKSVVFTLNGRAYRTDNLAPYQLGGLGSLIDLAFAPQPGTYQLTATPYSESSGNGIPGRALTVSFTVIDNHGGGHHHAARSREEEEYLTTEILSSDPLKVYPVPVQDALHVEVYEKIEVAIGLNIYNAQGKSVFTDNGLSGKFKDYSVSTLRLGMVPGVYYLQLQYADGRREVRKIVKE